MTARIGTSDGLAPVVDDLPVDHQVDVEPAADLAGSLEDAFLAHTEALGHRAAPQVVHAGAELDAVQTLALVPARHQRLRRAGHEPAADECLVEPEPELADVVGAADHEVAAAGEVVADPDAVPVERAAVVHPRLDVCGLRRRV